VDRIAGANWIYDGYGRRIFTDGPPATTVPATWLTGVQEEIIKVMENAGITPSVNDNTQLLQALGKTNAGGLLITTENSVSSGLTNITMDMGYVYAGTYVCLSAIAELFNGVAPTYPYQSVFNSGTAGLFFTLSAMGNLVNPLIFITATQADGTAFGICKISTSGTLIWNSTINQTGGSGNSYLNGMRSFILGEE
jgi:hypothetical protein